MNCRVVATYFGPRRNHGGSNTNSLTGEDAVRLLTELVEYETTISSGVEKDTIIVNHDFGHKRGREFLKEIDGTKTKDGKIITLNRDWNNGIGESYGSFNYAFEMFKNDYDYWFFNEDDYHLVEPNYFSSMIKQLDENDDVAFIGGCRYDHELDGYYIKSTSGGHDPHAHGGLGCTHKKYLQQVVDTIKHLPHPQMPMTDEMQKCIFEARLDAFDSDYAKQWYRNNELNGEVMFTNIYCKLGYKLQVTNHPKPCVLDVRGNKLT